MDVNLKGLCVMGAHATAHTHPCAQHPAMHTPPHAPHPPGQEADGHNLLQARERAGLGDVGGVGGCGWCLVLKIARRLCTHISWLCALRTMQRGHTRSVGVCVGGGAALALALKSSEGSLLAGGGRRSLQSQTAAARPARTTPPLRPTQCECLQDRGRRSLAGGGREDQLSDHHGCRPASAHAPHSARACLRGWGRSTAATRRLFSSGCVLNGRRPASGARAPSTERASPRAQGLSRPAAAVALNSDTNGRRRPASAHRPMLAPNPLCVLTGRCRRSQAGGGRDAQVRLEPSIITAAARPAEPATMRVRLRAGAAVTGWRRPPQSTTIQLRRPPPGQSAPPHACAQPSVTACGAGAAVTGRRRLLSLSSLMAAARPVPTTQR